MSGPVEPSAGRAVNANHSEFGEYAADWPTRTTSRAIWIGPPGVADGVTATDGGGDPAAELVGVTDAVAEGVEVGGTVAVVVAVAVELGVGGAVEDDAATDGVAEGGEPSDGVADGKGVWYGCDPSWTTETPESV